MEGQMVDIIGNLGEVGLFALAVVYLVLKYRQDGPGMFSSDKGIKPRLDRAIGEIHDLWQWHNVDDPTEPGRKIWYHRRDTEQALIKIADATDRLTRMMEQIHTENKEIRRAIEKAQP